MGNSRIDLFSKNHIRIQENFHHERTLVLPFEEVGRGGEKKSSVMRHRVSKAFLSEVLGHLKQIQVFSIVGKLTK